MPRSYSFDHFQVPKTSAPVPVRGKKKSAKKGQGDTELHYGQAHSQTAGLYAAHQMEAQLEELAGLEHDEPRMSYGEQRGDPLDSMRKSAPIGAMPTADMSEKRRFKDFISEGMRHVKLMREGTKDVLHAATWFVRMPRQMLQSIFHRQRHA